MSGNTLRVILCVFVSIMLVACGGGGGGGGSNNPPDTDKDGVADAQDAFPNDPTETKDTDKDGIGDNADAFPNDPKETKDTDKDGVGDNADIFPNDPKETKDTDKDGVGDNADAFPNDPKETKDTDKDGVGDNADAFPNDPAETVDADKDGTGDNADVTPLGQAIPGWSTFQGNAKHLGWVDISLATTNFKERWNKPLLMTNLQQGAAGDGYIFFNNGGVLYALDARTGETLWTRRLATGNQSFDSYNSPAYSDGIVYVQTGTYNSVLQAFNAMDGALVFEVTIRDSYNQSFAPSIVDGTVYLINKYYGTVYAFDAKTGSKKWVRSLDLYDYGATLAISDNHAFIYSNSYSPRLIVLNRSLGSVEFEIADSSYSPTNAGGNLVSVVAGDIVLGNYRGRLTAFQLSGKQLLWSVTANFTGQPVVKDNHLYVINDGVLEVRDLTTGVLLGSIAGTQRFWDNPLVTNNLVFVQDGQNSYAYTLETGALAWTLANKSGNMLLAEGALLVFTGDGVLAIDVEGDIDADGLPDWWEKRYKKNIYPNADVDNDGLTGLEEFNHSTNPLVADADGDKLLDGEEVANKTSSFNADTDGDGLDDYLEVKTHLTDPTNVDSDSDTLRDGEEIAVGLNPLDAKDALTDLDNDGFSNLHEVRANTGINDAASKPQLTEWSIQQGNQSRSSYAPQLLNQNHFSERWTISSPMILGSPVTAAGKIILRAGGSQLLALDSGTGEESWRQNTPSNSTSLNSQDGKLWYLGWENGAAINLESLSAMDGSKLSSKQLDISSYNSTAPLIQDGKVYLPANSYGFRAYTQSNGSLLWASTSGSYYLPYEKRHLLSANQLVGVGDSGLNIFSPTTGGLLKTISVNTYINSATLGTKGNVFVDTGSTLMNITTADGITQWINSDCQAALKIAAGNGNVYVLTQSKLCVIDQQNGKLVWTMELPGNYWNLSNAVLTASHLFYSNGEKTYAIDLAQRAIGWTLGKGANELLMGADGTLYLVSNYRVIAVDTEGDIDGDGLPQWWERRFGGNLDANADPDDDGLTNLEEYAEKTNPLVADTDGDTLKDGDEINTTKTNPLLVDTDKDGLSDAAEVNTHNSDPLVVDSDEDGIDDGREVSAGLDPDDNDDADADNDDDGFTNRDEILSGTDLANAASKPQVTDWAMEQANAAHNGFQPYRLDADNFALRWSKTFTHAVSSLATGDKQVFVMPNTGYSDQSSLFALNAVDGNELWQKPLGITYPSVNSLAYGDGKVLVNQYYYPSGMRAFDSRTGSALYQSEFTSGSTQLAPVIVGSTAYYDLGGSGIQAKNLANGATLWTKGKTNNTNLVANGQHIFHFYDANIFALDRTSGAPAFTIRTPSTLSSGPVLGSRNNILVHQSMLGMTSIDIGTGKTNWNAPFNSYSNNLPAVGNGQVYFLGDSGIYSIDEISGELRWFWYAPTDSSVNSNIVVTLSHVFVAGNSKTYALSATTGELEWTYNAGGSLALGKDGALYIRSGLQLVAISLEGDSDGDELPDWWERHYGLDSKDSSDAALDLDSDGLTNLEEFTVGSYADTADSDGDGLSDLEETNTYSTDPTNKDTDNDGMSDGWEVSQNLNALDPLDRDLDSDNDQVPNFFEFLSGTDPHDALSAPAFFSAGTYSFEDGLLPAGWELSAETTDVSITNNASHGTKALQARQEADIGFFGFFGASDLSLDIKSGCDSNYTVSIYIDDQLMATGSATSNWSTLKTVIPLGNHKVNIRTSSYCAVLIDNVVIAAAASNTGMGVQFVGLHNNSLQFVNAKGELVRSMQAKPPAKNVTPRTLATLGNEKVIVAFSGNTRHLGILDLQTLNWRYFDIPDYLGDYYYGGVGLAATGNYAYATIYKPTGEGGIARINLINGFITRFGSHHYNSIALARDGSIHAHANGVVYKYDAASLALVSQGNVITASQILLDSNDRLIVANNSEVVRYNAQRLVEARLQRQWINAVAVNERNELIVTSGNTINWYSSDWQRNRKLGISATYISSFPQPDTDTDGLPDWWELANGLDPLDATDAALDDDADGLNAMQEFAADTNPILDDTDGDLLSDGDEVNDFKTDPNLADSDGDTLTDAEEVIDYQTNPLLADTDGDLVPDAFELKQFGTDPKDATKKPAAYTNFLESFENDVVGWLRPVSGSNAGWSVASDAASVGSKSLRSESTGNDDETAQVEWAGLYNQSTLSFDMKSSSSYCCYINLYVDNELKTVFYVDAQWQTWKLSMTPGFHTVRFVYRKTTSAPNMYVWLDNVRVQ